MKTHHIKFRAVNRDIFEAIRDGRKKIETRACDEKFRDIKRGDAVMLMCEDDTFTKTVRSAEVFTTIEALLEKYSPQDINPACASAEDIREMYYSFPNYKEKIKEHGLIALELE
ncbi:MAG: hypothetical protein NUV61_02575 [Candidatus Azambacteria bacterium]|nr:hypothetical protein [Candidatus Azambacteria bacterium]